MRKTLNFVTFVVFARSSKKIVYFVNFAVFASLSRKIVNFISFVAEFFLEISGRWLLVKKPPEINLESKREQSFFYNLLLLVSQACFLKNAGISEISHVYESGAGDV